MNDYLARRRKELGLTQKEVADAVGVSEATVSRWFESSRAHQKETPADGYIRPSAGVFHFRFCFVFWR